MYFCVFCNDKPNSLELRQAHTSAHLDYIGDSECVVTAGALVDEEGVRMIGTFMVLNLPDRTAAESWSAHEPYAKAGLFERVEIHPWKPTANTP